VISTSVFVFILLAVAEIRTLFVDVCDCDDFPSIPMPPMVRALLFVELLAKLLSIDLLLNREKK
jgi:hypothetical protein